MTTMADIKQAILSLPKGEYAELIEWLHDLDEQKWDQQIEDDSISGRLEFLREEAIEGKRTGTLRNI